MAIKFTGPVAYQTTSNGAIWNNIQQASLYFNFMYDLNGVASQSSDAFVVARDFYSSIFCEMIGAGSAANTVRLQFGVVAASGANYKKQYDAPIGVPQSFVVTHDGVAGSQMLYANGIPYQIATFTGNTFNASRKWNMPGWNTQPGAGCIWHLDDVAIWNNYVLTQSEANALRDRTVDPTQIGASASLRIYWTMDGVIGNVPAISDPGISDYYGQSAYKVSTIGGTGTSFYSNQLVWVPSAQTVSAYVGTSGKTIVIRLASIATGVVTNPTAIYNTPTLTVNGTNVGSLQNPYLTGNHSMVMFQTPSNMQINPGDVVTIDAPEAWLNTAVGLAQSMVGTTVTNNAGKSCFGSDTATKTLKLGLNFAAEATGDECIYNLPRNWRFRMGNFVNVTRDSNGKPLSMGSTTAIATLWSVTADNGIDATRHPGPTGLFAVGWDDLNPTIPTTFVLNTIDGKTTHTTITERLDLYNPGTLVGGKQIGIVRVFDVQRTPGSNTSFTQICVWMTNAAKSPQFDNFVIYESGDFSHTDNTPVTLDRSIQSQYALSATAQSRLGSVAGSFRWMDTIAEYAASSQVSEPEDTRKLTDYTWGWGQTKTQRTIGYTQARPLDPAVSPYIYTPQQGSLFTATLGANITTSPAAGTIETITITDAATAPVFAGLRLFIDSEIMRVMSVSGTAVTVERGSESSAVSTHGTGTIQVGYRIPMPSFTVLCNGNGHVTELVTSSPHLIRSGQKLSFQGSWPTFNYTDNRTDIMTNLSGVGWVTGPNSLVMGTYAGNSTAATLSQSYTLNPANNTSPFTAPGGPQLPIEYPAIVTASFPGADLHINLSHNSTDALVDDWARRIRENFPSGRNIWVELSDEIWNTGFGQWRYYGPLTQMLHPGAHYYASFIDRSARIWQRFRDRFNENGANRGGEIRSVLNFISIGTSDCTAGLNYAASQGIKIDAVTIAPYIDMGSDAVSVAALSLYDTQQSLDLYIHWLRYGTYSGSYAVIFPQFQAAIANYNTQTGNSCAMIGYEGGLQSAMPSSITNWNERARDFQYDPNNYVIEQDFYHFMQTSGFQLFDEFAYSYIYYNGRYLWGLYHGCFQDHGRGDGSDGKLDNRLTLATPGLPNSKAITTSLDQNTVSVRGQAWLDWNAGVTNSGGGGGGGGVGGRQLRFTPRSVIKVKVG